MIEAKIICDSISPRAGAAEGIRLTTFVLKYPRMVHSELMTHRVFSRNASSSRAIPTATLLAEIESKPAMPVEWGLNGRGMQSKELLLEADQEKAKAIWLDAMRDAVKRARELVTLKVHKQIVNRLIEPFMTMNTLLTGTEYDNFFSLRAHQDAQPEIRELAYAMKTAYTISVPVERREHIPFGDSYVDEGLSREQLFKIATARAARVSYRNFEGHIDHAKDFQLHDDLLKSGHFSPFEHAAIALPPGLESDTNFRGWLQYRRVVEKPLQYNSLFW